jgi:hypothetical protein
VALGVGGAVCRDGVLVLGCARGGLRVLDQRHRGHDRAREPERDGINRHLIVVGWLPSSVAVRRQHIYWINIHEDTIGIGCAKLNGTGVNLCFIVGGGAVSVAVDRQHIYWANAKGNAIGRGNLDGTGVNGRFIWKPTAGRGCTQLQLGVTALASPAQYRGVDLRVLAATDGAAPT